MTPRLKRRNTGLLLLFFVLTSCFLLRKNNGSKTSHSANNKAAGGLGHDKLALYRQTVKAEMMRVRMGKPCMLNRPWYHIRLGSQWEGGRNYGDDLNLDLAAALLGIQRNQVKTTTDRTLAGKIMGIGSVLTHTCIGDIVLGTGLSFASKDARPESQVWKNLNDTLTKILSVRGSDTRMRIMEQNVDCPAEYGDLGVTASLLIWPDLYPSSTPPHDVCVVPHATDSTLKKEAAEHRPMVQVLSISPAKPVDLTKSMMDCKLIISSSLHVLMIADAYGIPTRWYHGPDSNQVDKYNDYYRGVGTDRSSDYATTLVDAINMGPMEPALSLEKMLNVTMRLLQFFPFDIVCE
jgi:pyruvyltransferase